MDESKFGVVILCVVFVGWLLTAFLLYWIADRRMGLCRKNAESFATIISTIIWVVIALIGCAFFDWGVEVPITTLMLFATSVS